MISNAQIITRADLGRALRDLPIETLQREMRGSREWTDPTKDLILFVDHADGNGRILVLKNRRLPGLNHRDYTCVPTGTILPSDWFDNLVCGLLDLSSPRVVLP